MVGLGNPGDTYAGTRHNVGADVVELLASRAGTPLKLERGQRAQMAQVRLHGELITLAVPTTYMNESGAAIKPLLTRSGVTDPARLVIVHDELDFEPGVVRLKVGGGLAGHNGLRSIAGVLGTNDFLRVRIGVGKPPSKEAGANHVLKKLSKAAAGEMAVSVAVAADLVETLVAEGAEAAMAKHHDRG